MNSSNCINHAALIILATLLIPAQLWAETQPVGSTQTESTWIIPLLLLALLAGAAGHLFYQKRSRPPCLPPMEPQDPFCEERITRTFIAALPSLSRELNLEIATSLQTEVLDRSDSKSVLGINLGSNTAQIRAPVTYRYHIRLREPWLLEKKGQSILVHAPFIRASQPPAIHTDQIQVSCARG